MDSTCSVSLVDVRYHTIGIRPFVRSNTIHPLPFCITRRAEIHLCRTYDDRNLGLTPGWTSALYPNCFSSSARRISELGPLASTIIEAVPLRLTRNKDTQDPAAHMRRPFSRTPILWGPWYAFPKLLM
jgi:hypothetical protein